MIYTFHPIFKETIWGGKKLSAFKCIHLDSEHVGESWEISDIPGAVSVVDSGPEAGTDLDTLIDRHGASLLGHKNIKRFGSHFPLLIKFIDASHDLSIQVHPGDEMAQRHHEMKGKTEMWYILDGDRDAQVLIGFNRDVTAEEFHRYLQKGTITDLLRRYPSRPGDVFYIPAGRIHSAGAGTFVAEIQQTSDITYRIYDYNRTDSAGNRRPLQVDYATEALDFTESMGDRLDYSGVTDDEIQLISSPYFSTRLYDLTSPYTLNLTNIDSFVSVLVVEGSAQFSDGEETVHSDRGRTLLVGASSSMLNVKPGPEGVRILTAFIE